MKQVILTLLKAFFKLISFLPMWIFEGLSNLVYLIMFYIVRYRKEVVFENLKNSFPEKSEKEIEQLAKAFFRHFVDYFFESIKSMSLSRNALMKRMKVTNPELLDFYYNSGRSIIMYASHYGNWEWWSVFPYFTKHQVVTFYQSLSNKYFDDIVRGLRENTGIKAIDSTRAFRGMMELDRKKILTFTFIPGDQCPPGYSPKYWRTFLHQESAFLLGADHIARRTNHVVVFPFMKKVKRGYYEVEFVVLHENPKELKEFELIDIFADTLEKQIRLDPRLWLWSHKRWKLNKSDWVKGDEKKN